ncbi:MAG: ABC transporter ATP-binding protein [Candidatus Sumerlaeota bacterium]|nr:ABC transporter ATP-binding protein [Candidatus Sumerlaeota bacterium]
MESKVHLLWRLMRGKRLQYGAAIAALALGTAVSFVIPLVIRLAIDGVIDGKPVHAPAFVLDALRRMSAGQALASGAGAILALTAASGVFMYYRSKWAAEATEAIVRGARDRLYGHLQRLPMAYHAKADTGDLVQRCTSDVETIRTFLSSQVVEAGRGFLMLIIVLPLMARMDLRMTAVTMAITPVIIAFSAIFFFRVKDIFQEADEAEGDLTTVLQENLTGIRVVRAFARQDFECRKFGEKNEIFRGRQYQLVRLMAWYWSAGDMICLTQTGVTLIVGAHWVARGQLSLGTLYAFVTYLWMLLWPVRQLGRMLTSFGQALVSLGRLQEILGQPVEDAPAEPLAPPDEGIQGRVAIRRVGFAYEPDKPVLKEVSVDIDAGRTLALLGPTGSGKSTLARLLARLYDYQEGSILLDGMELNRLDRAFVRSRIGVVLQEPFLFSKTVGENIRMARHDADATKMAEAAAAACIDDSIQQFERGYDTPVGERGVTLSGGQRQRVALARALLSDPPVLILDDTLSAVDTHTESMILETLKARHGRRTTILIAHRLSTLMHADWIVVLDKGRVVQQGTHQTLSHEEGLYQRLWRIQGELEEELVRD